MFAHRLYIPSESLAPKCDWDPGKWNGCKHVRSLHRKLPKGHSAKRKAKRKQQRAARKGK